MLKSIKIFTFFTFLPLLTVAQLDKINTSPIAYNPSFCGSSGGTRITMANFAGATGLLGSSIAYDAFSKKLKGGIGVQLNGHMNGAGFSNSFYRYAATVSYSPKITISDKTTWAPGVSISHESIRNSGDENIVVKSSDEISYKFSLMVNRENFFVLGHFGSSKFGNVGAGYRFNKNSESRVSSSIIANYGFLLEQSKYNGPSGNGNGKSKLKMTQPSLEYCLQVKNVVLSVGNRQSSIGYKWDNLAVNYGLNYGTYSWHLFHELGFVYKFNKEKSH